MDRWIRTLTAVTLVACGAAVAWVNHENAKLEAMMAAHTVHVPMSAEQLREALFFDAELSTGPVTTSYLRERRAELSRES